MKNMFRRITGRPADSFDQVEEMNTRKLPIPDLEATDKFVQFTAKRTKEGYWTISYKNNVKSSFLFNRSSGGSATSGAFPEELSAAKNDESRNSLPSSFFSKTRRTNSYTISH